MKIALKQHGEFLCAENGGDDAGVVNINRDAIGPWEQFTVHRLGDGFVALETVNGRFLSYDPDAGKTIANRARKSDLSAASFLRTVPDDVVSLPTNAWESFDFDGLNRQFLITIVEGTAPVPTLPRLHAQGWDLVTEDGKRWVCAGMTNFLLLQRYLEGQDIDPLLYAGADVYRVTGTMANVPAQVGLRALRPENYSTYWDSLDAFADRLASKGKRFEFTALCDMRTMGLDFDWQQRFVSQAAEVLKSKTNVLFELANEPEHATNQVDYSRFTKPDGLCCSRGSSLGGEPCPVPPWTYSTIHTPRSGAPIYTDVPPIYMITGYTNQGEQYPGVNGPCIINEPIGAAEENKPGSRSNDPDLFRRIARMSSAWSGMMFHCTDAVFSRPLGPVQERCRAAFFEGMGT